RFTPPRHLVASRVPPNGGQQSLPELVADLPHDRPVGRKRNQPATPHASGIHSVPLLHGPTVQRIVFTAAACVRIRGSQRQSIPARFLFVVQRLRHLLWVAGGEPLVLVSLPPGRPSRHVRPGESRFGHPCRYRTSHADPFSYFAASRHRSGDNSVCGGRRRIRPTSCVCAESQCRRPGGSWTVPP